MDANGDGAISRDEARGPMIERFKLMDADGNGAVSREEMDKHLERAGNSRDRARPPER
jgi:Ca2+-binding EF-hand superfamily protein